MTVPAYGSACQLGIDTVSTVTKRFDFIGESLALKETFTTADGLRGTRTRSISRVRAGNRVVAGQLTLQPNTAEMVLLLPWILGGTASGTSYPLAETVPSRYVVVDRVTKVVSYTTVRVNKALFRGQEGKPLELILDLIGCDESVGNAATFPSLTVDMATPPWMFSDMVLSVNSNPYSCKSFELTVDNMLDSGRFFNSQTLNTNFNAKDRKISVRTSLPYADAVAAYNVGAGGCPTVATFTNGVDILTLTMAHVAYPRESATVQGRNEVMLPLNGIAYHDTALGELAVVLAIS